jgi:hypothetical protein
MRSPQYPKAARSPRRSRRRADEKVISCAGGRTPPRRPIAALGNATEIVVFSSEGRGYSNRRVSVVAPLNIAPLALTIRAMVTRAV